VNSTKRIFSYRRFSDSRKIFPCILIFYCIFVEQENIANFGGDPDNGTQRDLTFRMKIYLQTKFLNFQ